MSGSGLMQFTLKKLRGRHKSIRFRFWELPKEALKLYYFRATGRSWIDYYADRLNTHHGEALPAEPVYLDVGHEFLEFLKQNGLQPQHRLLDYGCGILRGGLYIVPFLNPGNYVGIDISGSRIEQGRELMRKNSIPDDRYATYLVRDCLLRELEKERSFDYVWAHAVLMHMPENDIRTFLKSLRRHITCESYFFFTYYPSEKLGSAHIMRDQIRDFYYPTEFLQSIFLDMGYSFDILPAGYKENWGIRAVARLVRQEAT